MCTGPHPFIPVPNTARLRMVYSLYGQTVMNVFYFKGDAPLIAADLSGLVDECHTAWVANMKSHQPPELVLQYIEATALDADGGAQVTATIGEAGTATSTALPGGTTVAIKFGTGLSGRSNRGRMYWLQLGATSISGDQITSGTRSALITAVTDFFDDVITATGLTHVVVSYCSSGAWRTTGTTATVISYVLVDDNVDSQRRRLAGRGI